jgi:membrane associated rhomboid family serine protease
MTSRSRSPWLTLALILASLVFAGALLFDPGLDAVAGFNPSRPSLATAFASLFLHKNVMHLLGNMVFLASVGPLLEFSSSRWRIGLVFFLSGLAGVAGFWLMARGEDVSLIGASGAVAGLIGYASVRHMSMKVPVLPGIGVPAWGIAVLWILLQLLGGVWSLGGEAGGVSYWSHAGGFLMGLILAGLLGAGRQADLELGHEVLEQMNLRGPAASLQAAEKHIRSHPVDPKGWRQKADAHRTLHEEDKCRTALIKLLELSPEEAHPVIYRELIAMKGLTLLPPVKRAQAADRWEKDDPLLAASILETLVGQPEDEPQRPDAMLKLAELLREREPARSFVLLKELEAKYSGHGAVTLAKAKGLLTDGRP